MGIVTPLEKVNGFMTCRPEPTMIRKEKEKGGTVTERMHSNRFLDERVEFAHFHDGGFRPAFFRNQTFHFLAKRLDVFWMCC